MLKKSGQKGSVLIASLWAASFLSVFVSNVVFQSAQQAMILKREQNDFQARVDFLSTLHWVGHLIQQDDNPESDSPGDAWYGTIELPETWNARVKVTVSDEGSRIDLNTASPRLLEQLFEFVNEEVHGLEGKAHEFSAAVLELRGAEKILSFEELYLIEDIEKENLEILRPFLSAYTGQHGVNINTADLFVLKTVIFALAGDYFAKNDLINAIADFRGQAGVNAYFLAEELNVDLFLAKLKLSPTVHQITLANQLLPLLTADTRIWRIHFDAVSGKRAECVIRENFMEGNFKVVHWRDL